MASPYASPQPSLGIDIGGTFTDLVLHDTSGGRSGNLKVLTTHDDPVRGILDGVARLLAKCNVRASAIGRVAHATTLFTNALIERKGARTALVTTEGFADVLQIGLIVKKVEASSLDGQRHIADAMRLL